MLSANSSEFISVYNVPNMFDIIFLDVEMPIITGLQVAQTIRELPDNDVKIIFTSNYPEYMQDSFNVSAFQYFQKPIIEAQLHEQFKRIAKELLLSSSLSLLIRHNNIEEPIPTNQILYIETVKYKKDLLHYVCQHKELVGKGILADVESKLSQHKFFSPHRGFLINIKYIHYIKTNVIEMMNGDLIPLSRRREKKFRDYFSRELLQ